MKSIYYIIILLVGVFIFNGCETDENGPMPDTFEEAGVAYVVLDQSTSGLINLNDVGAFVFKGQIDVLWEPEQDYVKLMVAYNGDHTNAGVLVDNITSLPYDFDVSMSDVINAISALGSADDIEIGDYFRFYVNLVKGGKEYPIYTNVGGKEIRTIGSGLIQALQSVEGDNVLTDVRIDVPCGFSVEDVTGEYIANSDDWGVVDGEITIAADPNDPFRVYVTGLASMEGLVEEGGPVPMVIDPNSYNVEVEKTIISPNLAPWGLGSYVDYYYAGSGKLNTCDGTYNMGFLIGVSIGNWGVNNFTLTKK